MLAQKIASQIKLLLTGFDEQKMYRQMLKHYQIFQLIDNKGKWTVPALEKISTDLLPIDITESKAKAFVDEIASLTEKNNYLMHFLKQAQNETFEILLKKVKDEGAEVFPDVIAYAMVLERMTIAWYNDSTIAIDCIEHFQKVRKNKEVFRYFNFFHKLKLNSVETPFHKKAIKRLRTGIIPPTDKRWSLPINIFEALITDYLNGNKDNAKASWPLIVNRPGNKKENPKTGAGPSRWSEDKKAVSLHMPLPKEWADLYQTWNMAFVVQFPIYLYVIPKLLIPQVARYQDKPTEFIHNRILALVLTVNYSGFCVPAKQRNNEPEYDWCDKKLTALWGKSNLESAKNYKAKLLELNKK